MLHILKPLLRRPLMPLLLVLQIALACAIACNAIFLLKQKLAPIMAPDGIGDPSHLVVLHGYIARGRPWPAARLRQVQAELRSAPRVAAVSFATSLPMVNGPRMNADVLGSTDRGSANADVFFGDNLARVLGLRFVAGRDFTPEENSITVGTDMGFHHIGPVIITRALANRLYPDGHAVGQVIRYQGSPDGDRTIVGVVEHLIRSQFDKEENDLDYSMLFPGMPNQWPMPLFAVRLSMADYDRSCAALLSVVERNLGLDVMPGYAEQCTTYSDLRDQMLAQSRAAVWLLSGVTITVLTVTLIGIMGMTGYWVQQRTRSIGIRRALGACRSDVLREILIENALVVGVGALLGLVAAYGVNVWLMRHYELLRLPLVYLPIGAFLLLALGQLAALVPASRATRIPPIVATRSI